MKSYPNWVSNHFQRTYIWQSWKKVWWLLRLFVDWFVNVHCPNCQELRRNTAGKPSPYAKFEREVKFVANLIAENNANRNK